MLQFGTEPRSHAIVCGHSFCGDNWYSIILSCLRKFQDLSFFNLFPNVIKDIAEFYILKLCEGHLKIQLKFKEIVTIQNKSRGVVRTVKMLP